eukprot:5343195-Alexandrium_andersonii.AAC.2
MAGSARSRVGAGAIQTFQCLNAGSREDQRTVAPLNTANTAESKLARNAVKRPKPPGDRRKAPKHSGETAKRRPQRRTQKQRTPKTRSGSTGSDPALYPDPRPAASGWQGRATPQGRTRHPPEPANAKWWSQPMGTGASS